MSNMHNFKNVTPLPLSPGGGGGGGWDAPTGRPLWLRQWRNDHTRESAQSLRASIVCRRCTTGRLCRADKWRCGVLGPERAELAICSLPVIQNVHVLFVFDFISHVSFWHALRLAKRSGSLWC